MNPLFKYSSNTNYLNKDLRGGCNGSNFSLLDVCLDGKEQSVKIKLLNIFKDRHTVAKLSDTAVGYDEGALTNALWMKFYGNHGKYKPELNEYFHMYQCQILQCFLSQVRLVFLRSTLTIQFACTQCLYSSCLFSVSAFDAQQVFKSLFKALINED